MLRSKVGRWLSVAVLAVLAAVSRAESGAISSEYASDQYAIEARWDELREGRMLRGVALRPLGGGEIIEQYRDGDRLLSETEVRALGIARKPWGSPSAEATAEQGSISFAEAEHPAPLGTQLKAVAETLALPPYTPSSISAAEPASGEKPDNQIGDFRDFLEPVVLSAGRANLGEWVSLTDGGSLWRLNIASPGATGQRLHVAAYALPAGASLTVYNPASPDEAFRLAAGAGADHWMPSVFHEEVAIEVFAPDESARQALRVTLDRTVHLYAPRAIFEKAAGACNLNLACHTDWSATALGVCGLGVISTSGAIFCTGTLVADTNPCNVTNYVLTANHCVGGQSSANNLEFYWFYQNSACPGTVPALGSVPRTTGGANYLAGTGGRGDSGGGNDFTLLEMRNAPPGGSTYVGWTTATPALNTPVTAIHHPRGDYKRITFGALANLDNPFSIDYHEARWSSGTTEPGSSGCPLFLSASQQIVGQLWGGDASCSAPNDPDYFGRFSRTYPVVQARLDAGPTEASFAEVEFPASEADTSVTVTVTLSAPAGAGGHSVDYAATPGSAQSGVDFTPTSGTLAFPAGEDTATFTVTLLQDTHFDDGKTITLTLSAPSCGGVSASLGTATVVIDDDELDSDGDGVGDLDEVAGTYGPPTNPNLADTDGDGLTDREELFGGLGYTTNPTLTDTDNDGADDYQEILLGTDPLIPDAESLNSLRVPSFTDFAGVR